MLMVHSLPRTLLSFSYYHRREKSTPPLLVFCTEYYGSFFSQSCLLTPEGAKDGHLDDAFVGFAHTHEES